MTALSDDDVDSITAILSDTYGNEAHTPVVVVDGYGVTLTVNGGQLVIRDGYGNHRRERRLSRHQRTTHRIVILGTAGTVSLAALRWCTDVGITVAHVDKDGTLLAATATPNPRDARLRRAQALAANTPTGNTIAASLLSAKLHGHAALLDRRLDSAHRADVIRDYAAQLDKVCSDSPAPQSSIRRLRHCAAPQVLDRLREIEARAANLYFAAWTEHIAATFATRDARRVPQHWQTPAVRRSPLTAGGSPRKATDPVNAILNYAYALGEAECRRACLILGLDPALGVLHADHAHRDSLALDLLEPLRPVIETSILDLLAARHFRKVDFTETPQGQCRLTESVTHPLAAHLPGWGRQLAPIAEHVAAALSKSGPSKVTIRTPLTQSSRAANHPAARRRKGARRHPCPVAVASTCRDCGTILTNRSRVLCGACWPVERARLAAARAARGRAARAATTAATGVDPTQTTTARARRAFGLRAERATRDAWNVEHAGQRHDRAAFTREILPGLAGVPLSSIVAACGVTNSAASRIRRGILVPHARHWPALTELTRATLSG